MRKNLFTVAIVVLAFIFVSTFAIAQPGIGITKTAPLSGKGSVGDPLKITVCASGEVYQSNGTSWACTTAGAGDITSVGATASMGLTGGAASGAALLGLLSTCGDGQVLKSGSTGTAWTCNDDDNNQYTGGDGIALTAGDFDLDYTDDFRISTNQLDLSTAVTAPGTLATAGNATLGDAVTDAHTASGRVTLSEAVGILLDGAEANIFAVDTTSMAASVGGAVSFHGAYTGTTTTTGAVIKAMKTNGVDSEFGFDLAIGTRPNGGSVTERMRLYSTGLVTVFGDATFGDAATDQATVTGDLTVSDDATFSDTINVVGVATLSGATNVVKGKLLEDQATPPALSSCGGSPTITGSDLASTVTSGSAATDCTITFNVAYAAAPTCVVSTRSATKTYTYTVSTTAITIGTAQASTVYEFICVGH